MRNSRGNMLLIELVIVLIFFSLSQAVILQVFGMAQRKTEQSRVTNAALAMAQDVADALCFADSPDDALLSMRFAGADGRYVYDGGDGFDLYADVGREETGAGAMLTVSLRAVRGDRELFVLPAARYAEVSP